jgi:flagellar hook-associated protein 1 FlgK
LAGLIAGRDLYAYGRVAVIDELATAVIAEVNRIHADGQGLVGLTTLIGTQDLLATDVPLDTSAAGLPINARNGSFYLTVVDDATSTPATYRVDVDLGIAGGGTTLQSLVDDINAQVAGVAASITSDNKIQFVADDGMTFTFGHDGQDARRDTSGVLAALGVNTFFSGTSAANIAVNETLIAQPSILAASSVFIGGDGSNAGRLAGLETSISEHLGGTSITEFYNTIAGSVAVDGASAMDRLEVAGAIASSLQLQRERISGVNLDEEAISLVKYQRAFQGVSRYISVVDELLNQLVLLIR